SPQLPSPWKSSRLSPSRQFSRAGALIQRRLRLCSASKMRTEFYCAAPPPVPDWMRPLKCASLTAIFLLGLPACLQAFIGPGAGFAFVSSFLALFFALLLAVVYLLLWPIRFLFQLVIGRRSRRGSGKAKVKRMVIIGLDGFDPKLAARFM